ATKRATSAFYLAEEGAMSVMSDWDFSKYGTLSFWSSAATTGSGTDGSWSVNVTKMSNRLYFLLSTGTVTAGQGSYGAANRMVGIVARLHSATIEPAAALTTIGNLTIGGSSLVDGADYAIAAWDGYCDSPLPAKPGVLIDDTTNISREGVKHIIGGSPPIEEDPSLTAEDLMEFGDYHWNDLVALADYRFPTGSTVTQTYPDSVLVGGSYMCDTSNRLNWGNPYKPASACGSHFPVIYAEGDLTIESSDFGQGILLVEGNLTMKGGFDFFGPVVVRGTVLTEGTGGHFNGGLIAANADLYDSRVSGDAQVRYSSCAVERAVLNSSLTRVRPLERRSFVDLSSAITG
ncbi:MAG: hypothetical protein PVJ76_13305, partial [Gemmatimonadota bacterium]